MKILKTSKLRHLFQINYAINKYFLLLIQQHKTIKLLNGYYYYYFHKKQNLLSDSHCQYQCQHYSGHMILLYNTGIKHTFHEKSHSLQVHLIYELRKLLKMNLIRWFKKKND